jgi:hypothetical protein
MGGTCRRNGTDERYLIGKPEDKIPLRTPRHRWEDIIKMALKQILDWNHLARDMVKWQVLVNAVMNLKVPLTAGNFNSLTTISFSI